MPPLSIMFKTVSTDCNLDCSYCYYQESLEGTRLRRRIDRRMLETLIPQYMDYVADARHASLAWQGGEPTLAGLDFFRWMVALEAEHARPGTVIDNALQTNATLIDDAWSSFLAEYRFLVGVSLDGPEQIHDAERRDRGGHGSFRRVMSGIETLRRHGVELNILCVVGPHNINRAGELLRFFRREGFGDLQFIPAMDFQAMEPEKPPAYLIEPAAYGDFLVELFEEWYGDGAPRLSIRIFDNFLQSYLAVPNDLCVHGDACDAGLVVEHNGEVYPCDFYVHPRWQLGNINSTPLREILENPERAAFVGQKQPLPAACQACEWRAVCKGGCPRNRARFEDGSEGPDYFCDSYKRFFQHGHSRLQRLRERVQNRFRALEHLDLIESAQRPRPGRNAPCPCGSGHKQKACCADPRLADSYVFRV
jgi:uncharacterized protein